MTDTCTCGHENWWHWGNVGPCNEFRKVLNQPCGCRNFAAAPEGNTDD